MNLRALVFILTAVLLLILPVTAALADGTDVGPETFCDEYPRTWEWTASGSPYNLMGDVTFCETATLRIKEGVEVHSHGFNTLIMEGRLEALGKPDHPITMRSGDLPAIVGSWGGIQLKQDAAGGTSISRIQHAVIRHAEWAVRVVRGSHEIGPGNTIEDFSVGGINVTCNGDATPYIWGNLIRQREPSLDRTGTGIACHHTACGSDPRPEFDISENIFTALNTAVSLSGCQTYSWPYAGIWGGPEPRLRANCFEDNNHHLYTTTYKDGWLRYINADSNWWGTTDPAELQTLIIAYPDSPSYGTGPHVNFTSVRRSCGGSHRFGYVRGLIQGYERWRDLSVPYHLVEEITVADDATLEVDPGVHVRGRLDSHGTVDQPIIFESGAETPVAGDWPGLELLGPLGTPPHGPLPSAIAQTVIRHAD